MIFLTVGTHEPFDRLVQAIDHWCESRGHGDRVFGQITERAGYQPTSFDWVARLDPTDHLERCRDAEFIVSHAGMGSIITAMSLEKPIVIMPRRGHLGETRNDHQRATAKRFEARPGVYVATDAESLPALLDRFTSGDHTHLGGSVGAFADEQLIRTIRQFIHDPGSNVHREEATTWGRPSGRELRG